MRCSMLRDFQRIHARFSVSSRVIPFRRTLTFCLEIFVDVFPVGIQPQIFDVDLARASAGSVSRRAQHANLPDCRGGRGPSSLTGQSAEAGNGWELLLLSAR